MLATHRKDLLTFLLTPKDMARFDQIFTGSLIGEPSVNAGL